MLQRGLAHTRVDVDPVVILVVDDEPEIRAFLSSALEGLVPGARVVTAASGEEGLLHVKSSHVDLILTDYRMPGMDGVAFLRAVDEVHPDVPRAMITGHGDLPLAERAVNEGRVRKFLAKPVSVADLVRAVRDLLDEGSRRTVRAATVARARGLMGGGGAPALGSIPPARWTRDPATRES